MSAPLIARSAQSAPNAGTNQQDQAADANGVRVRIAKWGVALALAGLAMSPLAAQKATTNVVTPAPSPAPGDIGPRRVA